MPIDFPPADITNCEKCKMEGCFECKRCKDCKTCEHVCGTDDCVGCRKKGC